MKKIFLALGSIAILFAGIVLFEELGDKAAPTAIVLSDASEVNLVGVTLGTNHTLRTDFGRLLLFLPEPIVESVNNWAGNKWLPKTMTTAETNLVVWLEHIGFPGTPGGSRSLELRQPDGRRAGPDQYLSLSLGTGVSNRVHSVAFRSWPRREPWIECVILEPNANQETAVAGSFKIRNPWLVSTPCGRLVQKPSEQTRKI